ncbi:MAG: hypothetical protein RLN82_01740, partial [Pseudomonadales bacterium]
MSILLLIYSNAKNEARVCPIALFGKNGCLSNMCSAPRSPIEKNIALAEHETLFCRLWMVDEFSKVEPAIKSDICTCNDGPS